jgi:hypothetical protein
MSRKRREKEKRKRRRNSRKMRKKGEIFGGSRAEKGKKKKKKKKNSRKMGGKKEKFSGQQLEEKGNKRKKELQKLGDLFRLLDQQHSEKKRGFFWAFGQQHSPNWSCKERSGWVFYGFSGCSCSWTPQHPFHLIEIGGFFLLV